MTPSNSIAVNVAKRPTRAVSFILKSVWAAIVLLFVCLLWPLLFLAFLPFLILGDLLGLRKKLGEDSLPGSGEKGPRTGNAGTASSPAAVEAGGRATDRFIFDRRKDVSKLFGCNTRNVRYRWSLFARRLEDLEGQLEHPRALDFGAGSLRDSYELSKLGFAVVSVDLDESLLRRYYDFYDWQQVPSAPELFARPLDDLLHENGASSFDLAIAFDVIEHLEDPAAYIKEIRSLLKPDGLFFTIVPNKRSIFERYFKYSIKRQRRKGLAWIPGVPHLQFRAPEEWEEFFEDNGLAVIEHKMAIGPLVNDVWHGLLGLPLTVFVDPVLQTAAYKFRFPYSNTWLEAFCPGWLMERVNLWDEVLNKWLDRRFGWNLFVLQKEGVLNQARLRR